MSSPANENDSSPLPVNIRPATVDDAGGIASIFLESAEHHARLDPARYAVPSLEGIAAPYRQARHRPDAGEESITLVAEHGGEIVGFIEARLDHSPDPMHRPLRYCDITEIAVARPHRNRGIGSRLLQAAEVWGREHGADFAALEYHAANADAAWFYQRRMGYRVSHITAIKPL
jgi:ribosomal protein S18 acetylase RimI-like enzyme